MTGRRLRVRIRSEPPPGSAGEENWTLFARLAPQTVREFTGDTSVEFLPFCLTGDDLDENVYVSYNGGSIQEKDCIELAAGTLPTDVAHITVTPIDNSFPSAVTVEVEPLTTNDWESIEVYAELLQEGGLLQQVSVVYLHQVLTLRVGDSEMVRVRVINATDSPCRLLADTEVHIRPKPRRIRKQSSCVLRLVPSWEDYSFAMQKLQTDQNNSSRLRVAPCTILVNPAILQECGIECGTIAQLQKENAGNEMAVARVQSSRDVSTDSIVLHKLLRYQLNASPLLDSIRLEAVDDAMLDSCSAVEMVTSRTLCCSLERIGKVRSEADTGQAWLLPNDVRPQHLWCDSSDSTKRETSYSAQLRTVMASWFDLSDIDKELPFCNGSLIALPWRHDNEETSDDHQQLFRLTIRSVSEEDNGQPERMYVCADDLPYLLLKSSSAIPSQPSLHGESVVISLNKREHLLNLLPPTPNLSTMDQSNHRFSNLIGSLDCFDSIIFSGELGSGKTHAALMLAAHARVKSAYATFFLDCKRLQSSPNVRMKDILLALTSMFEQAAKSRPCLLVLDDIDVLVPNVTMGTDQEEGSAHQQQPNPVAIDQAKLIGDHFQNLMNAASSVEDAGKIVLVMTCHEEQAMHPSLLSQLLYQSVSVPSFNAVDREQLLVSMMRNLAGQDMMLPTGALLQDFGSRTDGFRPRDFDIVATRVLHARRPLPVSNQCVSLNKIIEDVLNAYTPISRQGIRAEDTSSSISWSHVGGLFRVKEYLSSSILRPVKYRRIYEHAPIRLPRGIVMYGPPGCGKSYLVPALARECGLTMITCRGPELLDKYIGASEAKVRQLFERAYAAAPSMLFLDEFDALAPVRGSDHTGVTDRVVNQLLTYLDGVEDSSNGSVYIVAATSRPDKVDPALLRPGRLEQHIFVGFPNSKEEWHDVLEKILRDREIDDRLRDEVQYRRLWETEGAAHVRSFSPSDIKAAVDTAYLNAVHEHLAQNNDGSSDARQDSTVTIQMHHMVKALMSTRPSLSIDDRRMLNRVYRRYINASDSLDEDESASAIVQGRLKTALR